MRDLSDNPYITSFSREKVDYSPNGYLFGEWVSKKCVDYERAYASLFELLAMLGFDVRLSGCKFLSRLVSVYLFGEDHDECFDVKVVADEFAMTERYVSDCILDAISSNPDFVATASDLLGFRIVHDKPIGIRDAVLIIGALSTIYYNYDVADFPARKGGATAISNRIFS